MFTALPHLEGLVDDKQLDGKDVGLLHWWLCLLRLEGGETASGLSVLYILLSSAGVEEMFYLLPLRGLLCLLCLLIGLLLSGCVLGSSLSRAATTTGAAVVFAVVLVVLGPSEQALKFTQIEVLQQFQINIRGGAKEAHSD